MGSIEDAYAPFATCPCSYHAEMRDQARALALAPLEELFSDFSCTLDDEDCQCDLHFSVRPIVARIEKLGIEDGV